MKAVEEEVSNCLLYFVDSSGLTLNQVCTELLSFLSAYQAELSKI